jgi:hypothetical protein
MLVINHEKEGFFMSIAMFVKPWWSSVGVRFQVLTATSMKFRFVFWDVLLCKIIVDQKTNLNLIVLVCLLLDTRFTRFVSSNSAEDDGLFKEVKNPYHNFLSRGSKAIGPML